jgi:sugar phosphate isomerase/epimerase
MRLSCIPISLFPAITSGQMPLGDWMDFAVELGLDGVECAPPLIQPLGPVSPAEFRRLAEERGLAVSNYTGYSDFTHLEPGERVCEIASALNNIEIALALGAPSMRLLAGQQRPEVDQALALGWVVTAIREISEHARRAGIRVNIENHTKAFTWTHFDFAMRSEVFLEMLDGLRDAPVGVQFDIANPFVGNEDALTLFERVKSRIGYVHVNDVARPGTFEFVAAGTGVAPIAEVLRRLSLQGYDGWVGIEEASRTGRAGFEQAVRYTRQALQEAMSARTAN